MFKPYQTYSDDFTGDAGLTVILRSRLISHAMNTATVKIAKKSAIGVAKYNASSPSNSGAIVGKIFGRMNSNGTRNRIWRVSVRKMDFRGCPVAWK